MNILSLKACVNVSSIALGLKSYDINEPSLKARDLHKIIKVIFPFLTMLQDISQYRYV